MNNSPTVREDNLDPAGNEAHFTAMDAAAAPEISPSKTSTKPSQEYLDAITRAQKTANSISASMESFIESCKSAQDTIAAISNAVQTASASWTNLLDYSAMIRAMQPSLQLFADAVRRATVDTHLKAILDAIRPIAAKARRVDILGKSNWPMYLVDDATICDKLDMLDEAELGSHLMESVSEIAYAGLDMDWLSTTRLRWNEHDELSAEEKGVLSRAISRHENSDYEGCVALLMNMFEGLIEKYCPREVKTLEGDRAELFDLHAKKYGVGLSHKKDGDPRKLTTIRDKVLIIVLLSENGWYTFQHAADYIINVTLTSKMDTDLAAHNPLRNKICHGEQTEYGTLEHSLKAILVTDIVIRFGAAVLAGRANSGCEDDSIRRQLLAEEARDSRR